MLPETVARLSQLDNIVGIKEATGDMGRLAAIQERVSSDFVLLSGDDESSLEFMLLGGHGVISVTANVVPAEMAELCELAHANEVEKARELDSRLVSLHRNLFLESNPIPVKWAVAQLGFGADVLRLPLTPLDAKFRPILAKAMRDNALLD